MALMKDPNTNKIKSVRDILAKVIPPKDDGYWDMQTKEYHDWKEEQRAEGIPEENIDRNEISFDLE